MDPPTSDGSFNCGPAPPQAIYTTPEACFAAIQAHARVNGYAFRKQYGKTTRKLYVCKRQGTWDSKTKKPSVDITKKRNGPGSKRCGCKMRVELKQLHPIAWKLTVMEASHNHLPSADDTASKPMKWRPVRLISTAYQSSRFLQLQNDAPPMDSSRYESDSSTQYIHHKRQHLQIEREPCHKRKKRCNYSSNSPPPSSALGQDSHGHHYSPQEAIPSSTQPRHTGDRKGEICSAKLPIPQEKRRYMQGTQTTQLCKEYRGIAFSEILDLDAATLQENLKDGVLIKNFGSSLEHGAKSSCALCRLFFHARIFDDGLLNSPQYQLRADSVFNCLNSMNLDRCPEELKAKDLPCLVVIPSSMKSTVPDASIKFILCHSDEYDHKKVFVPQAIPPFVDFSRAAAVLEYCQAKHHNLCRDYQTQVPGIKLMNYYKDASTPSELNKLLVLTPPSPTYVALGYVWGVSKINDTDPLPKVISDAMIVTKKLGFQYLWLTNTASVSLITGNGNFR